MPESRPELHDDEIGHIRELMAEASFGQEDVRAAILGAGVLRLGDMRFAGGQTANNKLDMTRLFEEGNRAALHTVVAALGKAASWHHPDALWGVPAGGQRFARAVGQALDLPVLGLKKYTNHLGGRRFEYGEDALVEPHVRMVGVEDVTTTFGSVVGCLQLPELREATRAVVAIWCRGEEDPDDVIMPDQQVVVEPLVVEPIPSYIRPSHPIYRQAVPADNEAAQ